MKPTFYPLRVKQINKLTKNAVAIEFDVPDALKPIFTFNAGQFLTLRTFKINGEDVRRTYSLCSNPHEQKWKVGIKKVNSGCFSTWANETLREGDYIDVMPPMGNFVANTQQNSKKNFAAFAAGSGITPILSIISTTLFTNPTASFTLVYGNQSRSSIMFRDELEALKNKYMHRLSIYHILSREKTDAEIQFGRIDAEKCGQIFSKLLNPFAIDEFFLCGPEEMSATVKTALLQKGIDEKLIRTETFTGKQKGQQQITLFNSTSSDSPKSEVTIRVDGMETTFMLAYDSDPILDAALHEGIELPYACKGGMCCTCKAKLVKGAVDMEVHYGLEHDEIEAGFILTCQSHPKTDNVFIDFDFR